MGAIVATRTLHGPVTRGEDDGLSLIGQDHLRLGLRAGLLLNEDEFSAFPIASLLAEQENQLQGKTDVAIEILMKTVEATGLVAEHKRGWLCLPGLVANFQQRCVFARIGRGTFTTNLCPVIGDFGEVGIDAGPEIGDYFRERVGEVLVVTDAKAIALHDDVAAKTACIVEQRGKRVAFRRRKNGSGNRTAALGESLLGVVPVQRLDSLGDEEGSGSIPSCVSHAASQDSRCALEMESVEQSARENLSDLRRQIRPPGPAKIQNRVRSVTDATGA